VSKNEEYEKLGGTMNRDLSNQFGSIDISEEVIANIAGVAATECYGIVGMASKKISDGFAELLGGETLSKGIKVSFVQDQVVIELFVIVKYGTKISEVAANVIEKVKYSVENYTGLSVQAVNITVQGVLVN
jgi:uncharacterized alkaline shock family protein YloU